MIVHLSGFVLRRTNDKTIYRRIYCNSCSISIILYRWNMQHPTHHYRFWWVRKATNVCLHLNNWDDGIQIYTQLCKFLWQIFFIHITGFADWHLKKTQAKTAKRISSNNIVELITKLKICISGWRIVKNIFYTCTYYSKIYLKITKSLYDSGHSLVLKISIYTNLINMERRVPINMEGVRTIWFVS